jgi:nicotinamidase-related amidase
MTRMNSNMSQLLIIDIQDKVLAPIPSKQKIVENSSRLIRAAGMLEIPITVSEQYPQGLGLTVEPLKDLLGNNASFLEKLHFSCMRDNILQHHLQDHRDNGRGQVIVAGIEAHVCVMQTVLDLIADGFEVYVIADATGSRADSSHALAMRRMDKTGAFIADTEMVIFEWMERAGTPLFKPLQALIK